ncbi:MAG: nicotinate-nucleotide adenylyltransferase [Lachnospiraceae bacterium]|nr:nicotinate-nucleotide adenylyltransferase [Lachnospiraceae bacterium]
MAAGYRYPVGIAEAKQNMEVKKQRKGIMGGTFDPIHNGHLMLAECARRQLSLDTILFLPSGNPPHKQQRRDGATDEQRLAMVQLAIWDYPQFSLDEEEMRRGGLTYTKDTILRLKGCEPETEFYFIIGGDSLMAFDTWFHPDIICENCVLAAAGRDALACETIQRKMKELKETLGADIVLLDFPDIQISSTELRRRCREHKSIQGLVPDAVRDYIEKNEIYGG